MAIASLDEKHPSVQSSKGFRAFYLNATDARLPNLVGFASFPFTSMSGRRGKRPDWLSSFNLAGTGFSDRPGCVVSVSTSFS